jgi:Smg protein
MATWRACPAACFSASLSPEHGLRRQVIGSWQLRYIEAMFEVLVFVYENYWRGDACPQWEHLGRKLSAVGFEPEEIQEALAWLNGLTTATRGVQTHGAEQHAAPDPHLIERPAAADSMRIFSVEEQNRLGPQCLGFLHFLESAEVLSAQMREVVIDRAMASCTDMLCLDDLKIIVLMVYWSFGLEPDALVLDELCDDPGNRVAH